MEISILLEHVQDLKLNTRRGKDGLETAISLKILGGDAVPRQLARLMNLMKSGAALDVEFRAKQAVMDLSIKEDTGVSSVD